MKQFLSILAIILINTHAGWAQNKYDYPVDPQNGKITISNTVSIDGTKSTLFRRGKQFIVTQNFDRIENIRCKDKSHVEVQIVSSPIKYSDSTDGVYIGNGFFNFQYRGKERFLMTFNYKLSVENNRYSYKLYNFILLEFVTAPKNKGKSRHSSFGSVSGSAYGGSFNASGSSFGGSSGFVEFSAKDVRKFDLEDFVDRSAFDDSDEDFVNAINSFKRELKNTLSGKL